MLIYVNKKKYILINQLYSILITGCRLLILYIFLYTGEALGAIGSTKALPLLEEYSNDHTQEVCLYLILRLGSFRIKANFYYSVVALGLLNHPLETFLVFLTPVIHPCMNQIHMWFTTMYNSSLPPSSIGVPTLPTFPSIF